MTRVFVAIAMVLIAGCRSQSQAIITFEHRIDQNTVVRSEVTVWK